MKNEFDIFLDNWYEIMVFWSQISFVFAGAIFLFYLLILSTKRALAKKHAFISSSEIKYLWYVGLCLALGFTFFINSVLVHIHTNSEFELVFKTFISLGIGMILGYSIHAYLSVYYPFVLEKRLNALRFKTRYNPNTGHKMRLLTEDEEDVHLTEEMIEHENTYASEYDVWLDEESGFKIIEIYAGSLQYLICSNCNYRTSKEYKLEVIKEPTRTESGQMIKYYKCSNCSHLQNKGASVPPLIAHYIDK